MGELSRIISGVLSGKDANVVHSTSHISYPAFQHHKS